MLPEKQPPEHNAARFDHDDEDKVVVVRYLLSHHSQAS